MLSSFVRPPSSFIFSTLPRLFLFTLLCNFTDHIWFSLQHFFYSGIWNVLWKLAAADSFWQFIVLRLFQHIHTLPWPVALMCNWREPTIREVSLPATLSGESLLANPIFLSSQVCLPLLHLLSPPQKSWYNASLAPFWLDPCI